MTRKKVYDYCKLCGEYHRLSYEHIPPKCCHNDSNIITFPINMNKAEDTLQTVKEKYKYIQHQQGYGDCVLCKECNSYCGTYYVPAFEKFYNQIFRSNNFIIDKQLFVDFKEIQPLPIIKEIYTIFLDINPFESDFFIINSVFKNYRKCILNKDSLEFGKIKLRIFLHIATGEGKILPFQGKFNINEKDSICFFSEFIFKNLGLLAVLEIGKHNEYLGCEITNFSNYIYDKKIDVTLKIPFLESHTKYSNDYRSIDKLNEQIKVGEFLLQNILKNKNV